MKKIFTYLLLLFSVSSFAQVVITSDNSVVLSTLIEPSAELRVYTNPTTGNKGMLIPRLTAVQMYSIASPDIGVIIYNTNDNAFEFYNGTTWDRMGQTPSSAAAPTGTHDGELYFNTTDKHLYVYNSATLTWVQIGITATPPL
jgi:hypothetical protein